MKREQLRRLWSGVESALLWTYVVSLLWVLCYAVVPPVVTPLMVWRMLEGALQGHWVGIEREWVPVEQISPSLLRALIAAEDARFAFHYGFDWRAIEQARRRNERLKGRRLYGASTISMQTAKNAFLLPLRSYLRKAAEAYLTVLLETFWGKRRILEVYANIVEWGSGIYGAEAAARRYFGVPARQLTERQASLLAAVLPNPRRWSPVRPTPYIVRRSAWVRARMPVVTLPPELRLRRSRALLLSNEPLKFLSAELHIAPSGKEVLDPIALVLAR